MMPYCNLKTREVVSHIRDTFRCSKLGKPILASPPNPLPLDFPDLCPSLDKGSFEKEACDVGIPALI